MRRPGRRRGPLRGCHDVSCFCHAALRKCHVLSWAHAAASCFSRSSRCLCRSRHASNSGVSGRRSVALPSRLAGGVGGGPLGVTGLCRASPAASAGAKAGPLPASPASPGLRSGACGGGGFRRRPLACGRFRRQFGARVGFGHACLLPGKGRDGASLFRASSRGRACAGAGGRIAAARLARLIARASRRTHLARPFPPGCFSRPPAIAFCRNAERRPRKPPLSTFILHHTRI